jgi:hypothetical protein
MSGITNPAEEYFKDGLWGWNGSKWKKLALLLGYTDRWAEDAAGIKSGAGTYQYDTAAVPSGYVYVAAVVSLLNITGARGMCRLFAMGGANYVCLAATVTPAQYVPTIFTGMITLKEGDYLRLTQLSCQDGDVLYGGVYGYKMAIS